MKQTDSQKNTEKMNESFDTQQKTRKAYIENHPASVEEISKKIVDNSFIMSIAERYNNGKPYNFSDIRQFMKFINDFFRVELQGKSDIPQLDLQNIVKFNTFDDRISNSYQCATFSHDFIMGNSKEEYFKSSFPRLIFYYNDNLGNLDHYQLEINFTWDIHLKYGFYSILEKFNNDNFFDPEKPIYIAKFMHFIMNLYKKFNSIEFKRIMKANTKKKISDYKTICCIEYFLALKNENHYRKHEFYKTFYEEWTLPYKISWNNFAKYWNTKIVPDKPDMQIKSTIYYKDSVSESMNAVRKMRKQKENAENAETTQQKAEKFADNIVLKSKIRELFTKYAPEEKNQDLNNPEIFIQIVNGYLTHYLHTPINLQIYIIKEKISSKNGNGFLFNTYYPTQKNLHAWLLSNKNLKNYEMYYNFPFNYIKSVIFFRKNFMQALFKGNIAYDVKIDLKFRLLIENDVVSQIDLIFSAGINNSHHTINEFTIYFPISDLNNSDSVFQIFSCCTKILERIETPEFLAYMLTCRILDDNKQVIVGIHKNKIIEQYILVSVFMDIDKSGRLQKEYADNKKLILQTDSAYAKDANDTYHDKLDYARRCFKLCDNEYINSNTQVDESMNAWKKNVIVNSHKEDNAGKKIVDETFVSKLFMNFFPESKNHDLNDEKNIIGIIRGFIRKKYNDSSIQLALAEYSYSETEATTKKYKKYFRVEDNTVMLNTKTEGLLDKEKYHLNMIVSVSYSDRNIESISLNLFYGTGDYEKGRQINIFHVPFLKDKCLNLYYFIKYLNETIDILRSSQFAAFILTYNELYQNKPNDYDTDSFMVNFLFYSIFLNVMKKDKSKKQEINNVFMFMNDNDIDANDAREKKTIMKIYNQQLESVNRQSEIKNSAVSESMDVWKKLRSKQKIENTNAGKKAAHDLFLSQLFLKFAPDSKSHDLNDTSVLMDVLTGYMKILYNNPKLKAKHNSNLISNDKELTVTYSINNPFNSKDAGRMDIINSDFCYGVTASFTIKFVYEYSADFNRENSGQLKYIAFAIAICNCMPNFSLEYDIDQSVKIENQIIGIMKWLHEIQMKLLSMKFMAVLSTNYILQQKSANHSKVFPKYNSLYMAGLELKIFTRLKAENNDSVSLQQKLFLRAQKDMYYKKNTQFKLLWDNMYAIYKKELAKIKTMKISGISESMDAWKKVKSKQEFKDNTENMTVQLFISKLFMKYYPEAKTYDLNDVPTLANLLQGYIQKRFLRKQGRLIFSGIFSQEELQTVNNFAISNKISDIKKYSDCEVRYDICHLLNLKTEQKLKNLKVFIPLGNETTVKHLTIWVDIFFKVSKYKITGIRFIVHYEIGNSKNETKIILDKDFDSINNLNMIMEIFRIIDALRNDLSSMKFESLLDTTYILQDIGLENIISFSDYQNTTAHKVSLYAPAIKTFSFMKMGKSEISYEEYELDDDSKTKKGIINFDDNPSETEEISLGLKIFNSEIIRIKGDTTDTELISESMDAQKRFSSTKKDNSTPEELGKNIAEKYELNKLFDKFSPDIDIKNRNTQNLKSVIELLTNFCKEKFDHHYFFKDDFINLKSRTHLYQKDEIELKRDKPYIPQIILNPRTKCPENHIALSLNIPLSFKILSLTSEYGCLESIKIKLNFINFGKTRKRFENTISITYQIKNNTDFEAIFSIMKFISGFNEFLKDGKCDALMDTMYLSFTQNNQRNHLIPPMSSAYYNKLICDLLKEYDNTGELQQISEQHQKWIMESKENQLKYEIVYQTYLKQYDKFCRKIKKSEGGISESMDAWNKIARQHSNDKIKNNTDEMIWRSALMSLCGGQDVDGKTIVEMIEMIIPRIFRKIHGLVPDAEKEPQFIEIPNQDKTKNYPSMQSYEISAIPLISLKKEFSKNINQNSENDTIFTDIQIRSKNILKSSTSSDTGTAIITTLSDKTVSELSCKHFTINFNQYNEGYKYAPDPDNYLTLGCRIEFDINFYIGNPGILKYSEDNYMSYSQKYSILALFIRHMLKALDFLISPLLTEGLKQMLVILKDINLNDLKERDISIINFFTTFEYFIRKHVSNFNGIAYDNIYKDRDEYDALKYEPEIQENARKFSEKFYDEHLKELE